MTLAVFHSAYKNKKATEEAIKNFRKFNNGPYFLVSDGGDNFSEIAEKYDCFYYHSEWNLKLRDHNDPSGIYGNTKEETLEWLRRFYTACTFEKSNHIMMMEDDVLIKGNIMIEDDVEFCGLDVPKNRVHQELIDYLTEKYDAKFYNNWYALPGGSIFKTKTFVENYDRITKILNEEFDYIKSNLMKSIGYVDVWMTVYYALCKKEYTVNPYMTETTTNPNWRDSSYAIVHHYKEHYEHFGYFYG
jgi:hypothetical protein